jgi:aminoglycoside phosphotransferase
MGCMESQYYAPYRHLADQFADLLGGRIGTNVQQDKSSIALVVRYHKPGQPPIFAKTQLRLPDDPLAREAANLRWCSGKLPVPTVLGYAATEQAEFLVLEGLDGMDGAKAVLHLPEDTITEIYIDAMLRWHSTSAESFSHRSEPHEQLAKLARDLARMSSSCRRGDAGELEARLNRLRADWPATRRRVLTHGDFSLPNVMISGRQVTGYLDVSDMAIADPARDVASAVLSLRRNLDSSPERAVTTLLKTTGAELDQVERWITLIEIKLSTRRLLAATQVSGPDVQVGI